MQRGDMFVYKMQGKARPVLVLRPAPAPGGVLVVGFSSKDFGGMGVQISGHGLLKPSWITPQINVFYNYEWVYPLNVIGTIPEPKMREIEQALLEYIFGHLLEPIDTHISS